MKSASWSRVLVGYGVAMLAVGMIVAAALSAASASAAVIYPPRLSAAVRTAEGFELKGIVYNYGGTTTYHFEYGTTTAYGTSAPMPDADAGPALASQVSQPVTGLAADTVYHYRLVSTNSVEGTGTSEDGTFSTAVTPPPPPPPPGGGPNPTPPGKTPPGQTSPGKTTPGQNGPGQTYPGEGTSPSSTPTVPGNGPKTVAKSLRLNGHTLLTTTSGRTLYSLSAERHGKFICTEASGCTGIWHPLTVASGVVPKGPVKLGTIRRPEGTTQVTYRGLPLYTFTADKKRGQVKGDGLKDVGTWHPATVQASPGSTAPRGPGTY
jgi:predicted lipoprotein with Yx(FWY)xxD motif